MSDLNLRARLIRLAHDHPELQGHLLPILKEGGFPEDEMPKALPIEDVQRHTLDTFALIDGVMGAIGEYGGTLFSYDLYKALADGYRKAERIAWQNGVKVSDSKIRNRPAYRLASQVARKVLSAKSP